MQTGLNERLKKILLDILLREGDPDAWEQLKKLDLNRDDLDGIMRTRFAGEAWELFKTQNGTEEDFMHIIEHAEDTDIKKEAELILMNRFSPSNKSLEIMVRLNRSDAAAAALLNQNPDNSQLVTVISYSNHSDQAGKELLSRSPDKDELYKIIKHSTLKAEAWDRFIQQSPTNEEIIRIVQYTDWENIAWLYLLEQNPSNEELMAFAKNFSETGRKQKEAAMLILNQKPSVENLVDLLIQNEFYVDEAWEMLEKRPLTEDDLDDILWMIRWSSVKKNEAAELCLKYPLEEKGLWDIFTYTDHKDEAAQRLIQLPLEWHQLVDLAVESSTTSALNKLNETVQFDTSQVNETELIREIAKKLLADPELLDVNHWHNKDRHCLGGWAITLHKPAQEIEKQYSSEIAACFLIPNYRHLFFADRETVLSELMKIVSA